jgi:hypothetical protein
MRSNTVNGYKMCFKSVYENLQCKLGCKDEDTIGHVFECTKIDQIQGETNDRVSAIFARKEDQIASVSRFIMRDTTRTPLLEAAAASQGDTQILDTSTPASAGCAGATTGDNSQPV